MPTWCAWWVPGPFAGVKRPELTIDHSSASKAGGKNECIYGWNRKKLPISVQTKRISSCCSCKLRFDLCLTSLKSAQLAISIAEMLVSCSVIVLRLFGRESFQQNKINAFHGVGYQARWIFPNMLASQKVTLSLTPVYIDWTTRSQRKDKPLARPHY